MKKTILFILFFFLFFSINLIIIFTKFGKINLQEMPYISILYNGRIKSINFINNEDNNYKKLNNLFSVSELFLDPNSFYFRYILNITNNNILTFLKLPLRNNHLYSFAEINLAFNLNIQSIYHIKQLDVNDRTIIQNQLVEIYSKLLYYFEISYSTSLLHSIFIINNIEISSYFMISNNKFLSYFDILRNYYKFLKILKKLQINIYNTDFKYTRQKFQKR